MTDAFLHYLAVTGYYSRGYKDAWAGLVRYEKYRHKKRYVHRVCVDCGDERDVIENSHPSERCPRCARIKQNEKRVKKAKQADTGFIVTFKDRNKIKKKRLPDKQSVDRLADTVSIISIEILGEKK